MRILIGFLTMLWSKCFIAANWFSYENIDQFNKIGLATNHRGLDPHFLSFIAMKMLENSMKGEGKSKN